MSKPNYAQASFFSSFKDLFLGFEAKAEELDKVNKPVRNSQNMKLLETSPSLNPDVKNAKEVYFDIESDEALAVVPTPLGEEYDLEKNASEEKIDVYVVKEGDTLKTIARKFGVDEKAILASNADIKKADLTKAGQTLVILPTKSIKKDENKIKEQEKKKALEKEAKELALEKKKAEAEKKKQALDKKDEAPEKQSEKQPEKEEIFDKKDDSSDEVKIDQKEDSSDKGEQSGTVKDGYIWPFPKGTGVVTQGLHDDQAYDFGAPKGTPIYAIQDGQVLIARPTGYNGGYGLYVVINFEDGRQAILGHMSRVVSESGDVVKRGDIIGYVGSTGRSTGPHVHIGFRGTLRNPYSGLPKGANSSSLNN